MNAVGSVDIGFALDAACSRAPWCARDTLEAVLTLAAEIVRDGHEGLRLGALFAIGRHRDVLACSRPLILDPIAGHAPQSRRITDDPVRGTVKALARLDGAFVIREDGVVVAACRYLDVSSRGVDVPLGLGSRHVAAAALSKRLGAVAVAASATGTVRVFCDGEVVARFGRHDRTATDGLSPR
jgi:DNA integrity scanning protein DisA with diadenylate cyclase activity